MIDGGRSSGGDSAEFDVVFHGDGIPDDDDDDFDEVDDKSSLLSICTCKSMTNSSCG